MKRKIMQCTSLGMLIRKGIVYLLALDFFLGLIVDNTLEFQKPLGYH